MSEANKQEESTARSERPVQGDVSHHEPEDAPWYEAEDCEACGCAAGEFADEDWDCGTWKCPECGAPQ